MKPGSPNLLRAICCALAVTALPIGSGVVQAKDVESAWFPLRVGAEWVYETHRDQTYSPEGAPMKRIFHAGSAVRVAEAAPERTPGAFLLRERSVLQPVSGSVEKEENVQWTVYSLGSGVRMHASGEIRPDGTKSGVAYEPPVQLLPTTTVGESWKAGSFRSGDQQVELSGEVVGIEDSPGEPSWPGCLRVRLHGTVSGHAQVEDSRAEIVSSKLDRTLWFARGVGIVRDVTNLDLELKLPDGHTAHSSQVLTQRLLEYRPPK